MSAREILGGVLMWLPADGDLLPDDESTVLLYAPGNDEPVWPGYRDGESWRWADGTPAEGVTHWTGMPQGPNQGLADAIACVEQHKDAATKLDASSRVICDDCAGEGCDLCDGGYLDDLGTVDAEDVRRAPL